MLIARGAMGTAAGGGSAGTRAPHEADDEAAGTPTPKMGGCANWLAE